MKGRKLWEGVEVGVGRVGRGWGAGKMRYYLLLNRLLCPNFTGKCFTVKNLKNWTS